MTDISKLTEMYKDYFTGLYPQGIPPKGEPLVEVTEQIPLTDLPLYIKAGKEKGIFVYSIAREGETFSLGKNQSAVVKTGYIAICKLSYTTSDLTEFGAEVRRLKEETQASES